MCRIKLSVECEGGPKDVVVSFPNKENYLETLELIQRELAGELPYIFELVDNNGMYFDSSNIISIQGGDLHV